MSIRIAAALLYGWAVAGMVAVSAGPTGPWKVTAPGGRLAVEVQSASKGALTYTVLLEDEPVLLPSPLGLVRDDQRFDERLSFVAERRTDIREEYTMPHGKRRQCRAEAAELTLAFRGVGGAQMELVVRAYDDGAAFRYRFPGGDGKPRTIKEELTGFQLPVGATACLQPYDPPSKWTPAYERFFENNLPAGALTTNKNGWCFPALFRVREGGPWLLVTEALLDGSYCGGRLASEATGGLYRIRFPDPGEGLGTGEVHPSATAPWATPWRVIIAGPTLAPLVESSLVNHLNPPSTVADTSWIKPGRVAWSWWSEQDSPRKPERMKAFIDLAADMGWEYFLVDANWNYVEEQAMLDLIEHARNRNVGILLWYNSGGPHNEVTEAPRDRMMPQAVRRREFEWLKKLGVKGVKVDFFQSDKQNVIRHYIDILQDAAAAQMMVNFHGCTMQRGWARTYPHLLTMEGVRGAECYIFDPKFPERAPSHNTILAFTRNVCGSMDYTPVTFSDNRNPHKTTMAHELALSVVFESGWQHLADSVAAYRAVPDFVKAFLREVPAAWEDIKFISGAPGHSVVLARRSGDQWFVGGINAEPTPLPVKMALDFLPAGDYAAVRIEDGEGPREFAQRAQTLKSGARLDFTMKPFGGFVVQLKKQ